MRVVVIDRILFKGQRIKMNEILSKMFNGNVKRIVILNKIKKSSDAIEIVRDGTLR